MKNITMIVIALIAACSPVEGADGGGTSSGEGCFGQPCQGTCAPGLVCEPHPDNASLAVCAAPCCIGQQCAVEADGCGEPLLGECRNSFSGTPLCFPVLDQGPS